MPDRRRGARKQGPGTGGRGPDKTDGSLTRTFSRTSGRHVSSADVSDSSSSSSSTSINSTNINSTNKKKQPAQTRRKKSSKKPHASPTPDPRPPTPAPSVAIVGAGRLGTALARALAAVGYDVRAVVARRRSSARRASRVVGTEPIALSSSKLSSIPAVDLLIVATPDDALAGVCARLADEYAENVRRGAVALHASGAVSSDVLAPLRARGFAVGSMHPLVAVSDPLAGASSLRRAFFCLEGDARALALARRVVRDLGGRSFTVPTEQKALYHAAAVMTSGHTVALFNVATRLLTRCGLGAKQARAILLPLLRSTLENLSAQTPARALTGTFARADAETVRRHLSAFESEDVPEALAAYVLLGRHSLKLAEEAGADREALREIERLLKQNDGLGSNS